MIIWTLGLHVLASINDIPVALMCKHLHLYVLRATVYKHDFRAAIDNLRRFQFLCKRPLPSSVSLVLLACGVLPSGSFSLFRSPRAPSLIPTQPALSSVCCRTGPLGGGVRSFSFSPSKVEPFIISGHANLLPGTVLKYVAHVDVSSLGAYCVSKGFVHAQLPVSALVSNLSVTSSRAVAKLHGIGMRARSTPDEVAAVFDRHKCESCDRLCSVFVATLDRQTKRKVHMRQKYAQTKPKQKIAKVHTAADTVDLPKVEAVKQNVIKGTRKFSFSLSQVEPYVVSGHDNLLPGTVLKYVAHVDGASLDSYHVSKGFVHAQMPVFSLIPNLSITASRSVARMHGVPARALSTPAEASSIFENHSCVSCNLLYTVFVATTDVARQTMRKAQMRQKYANSKSRNAEASHVVLEDEIAKAPTVFPPPPLSSEQSRKIISGFCRSTGAQFVEESGCAICGLLTSTRQLKPLKQIKRMLSVLTVSGVTRVERNSPKQKVKEYHGPVLDYQCNDACESCRQSVVSGKIPKNALANGMWLGAVPQVLKDLRFVEKLLVARVRRTRCYTRVTASGLSKMKAHVIAFEAPIERVYDMLPPPIEDLDDVLAVLFTGSCKPTPEDLKRTPLLVRRKAVMAALEWLRLNHTDYKDVGISLSNLNSYPEDTPPVCVVYRESASSKSTEDPSVFDTGEEDGAVDGECPFIVHGLTGEQMATKSIEALKGIALKHWQSNGKALRVGHSEDPKSTFNDPSLYPQMFPWLFPYGLGGVGASTSRLSAKAHKRNLLMYHDKRFQTDTEFPFVAFSHEQVKAATSGGYLAVNKNNFNDIADRLLSVNQSVLEDIGKRMAAGEVVKPKTDDEKLCFQVVNDLDTVSGKVEGSHTSKKYMRNEIWSLMASKGAPSWYITLSPADVRHPICLYFAGDKRTFQPSMLIGTDDAFRLIAKNPVAGARFFHFMVSAFIKHVLAVDNTDHSGLYGDTSAYYGTVEQQGRLTLHLHLLLWIQGGVSPEQARCKIMDVESDFQRALVDYLEAAYRGDFLIGTCADVADRVEKASKSPDYVNPTQTIPETPPEPCENKCEECKACISLASWWGRFCSTVDDLLFRSNVHTCTSTLNRDGTQKKNKEHKGCLDNIWGKCKGRFPRQLFSQTEVDPVTGSLNMKKTEGWLNTISAPLTYLFRCNTDVTSLRSGTAIKAILLYVTKYVTKPMMKTYVAFDAVKATFHKNTSVLGGSLPRQEKARSLMTKMVNTLSARSEMGSPMISMYLLQNPDHYTNYKFENLHWTSFVREVRKSWDQEKSEDLASGPPEKIPIIKVRGRVVGLSSVYDYAFRGSELEGMSLFEWASRCKRVKLPTSRQGGGALRVSRNKNKKTDPDDTDTEYVPTGSVTVPFCESHPLAETHATTCYPPFPMRIPNFIGGTLPRRDQGDREYYCCTMLTLFKPWRTGLDLKDEQSTWDESFLRNTFSEAHSTVMNNMNLRYECLDASDDFHAQMKAGGIVFPGSEDDGLFSDLDQQEYGEGAGDMPDDSEVAGLSDVVGKSEQSRRSNMALMSKIMDNTGWSIPLLGRPSLKEEVFRPSPIEELMGSQWKARVADKRAEILAERSLRLPLDAGMPIKEPRECNIVDVVSKAYLERTFLSKRWEPTIQMVSVDFCLNSEQERAFRIVANHAAEPGCDQLRMYMGGMGGTGKTQVLKALMRYFELRNESHRLVVVAPTGTAASLLGGSTYHYLFGINEATTVSKMQLAQVKSRLTGVDYVFFDEVSMLSCRDLCRIGTRLSQISNELTVPFGGFNMLFAGDFAQLPPVIGGEHASLYSRTVGSNTNSIKDQEAAIGKSAWHQITTVVILRQNMRQRTQTPQDAELRCALENMRYKACTPADIAFLRSRIASSLPGKPKLSDPTFRDVSIITALNVHKDSINSVGARRFALESNQKLTDFYSEDTLWIGDEDGTQGKRSTSKHAVVAKSALTEEVQRCLWQQPACSTNKNIAGKLSICKGLPIIIRHNAATELCITNGQEGTVYDWQSASGNRGQRVLDTLFVKLKDPPKLVQLDGLPENVVPLVKTKVTTVCQLTTDERVTVNRSQVEVLINYSMTDYASQGKTRPVNVVDLNNCRSHQSYYTALSRSASAAGTLILQGFDTSKITGKASGALRQEFRELELLDEITRLRYVGKLPKGMHDADRRNTLIASYRERKGESYVPQTVHRAIRWSKGDPYMDSTPDILPWKVIGQSVSQSGQPAKVNTSYVPAKGSNKTNVFAVSAKRKAEGDAADYTDDVRKVKKLKIDHGILLHRAGAQADEAPSGTQWRDNSCAYDAVVTILYSVWKDDPLSRTVEFVRLNATYLGPLSTDFSRIASAAGHRLEDARDTMRRLLGNVDCVMFGYGEYTSVHSLLERILTSSVPVTQSSVICTSGHVVDRAGAASLSCQLMLVDSAGESLQDHVNRLGVTSATRCVHCNLPLVRIFTFVSAPTLISFDLSGGVRPRLNYIVDIPVNGRPAVRYALRGVVYYGEHHFTCRVVSESGHIWYHDGMRTGSQLRMEGSTLENIDLLKHGSMNATAAIYVRA